MTWLGGLSWVGSWLNGSELAAGVVLILVKIAVALGFVPLIYLTAAVLVAVVALPMMLERVARRDYSDLEQRHGGSNLGSIWNAIILHHFPILRCRKCRYWATVQCPLYGRNTPSDFCSRGERWRD